MDFIVGKIIERIYKMSLNADIFYESSLMANISYEDIIKLAQIYSVGKDITNHMSELIEKEVIANQKHYQKLLKTTKPDLADGEDDDSFPYPLKPIGVAEDTYTYDVIIECLRDPTRADEYVGPGREYEQILENSKTLKTITEEKKNKAHLFKPLTEEEKSKLTTFEKMKLIVFEAEPCDEIKLMIINHIENRNGGLSEEMLKRKSQIVKNVKEFEAQFELAGKEAKIQSRIVKSWSKLSDELCSFFLRSDVVNINEEKKALFENGYEHIEPNGSKINLKATIEKGHISINDGKTEIDRLSLYVRKSNTTIPPTLHISFRGTEGEHFLKYIWHDYKNMENHYNKMKPIIDEIIKQELAIHKETYGDTPLNINWSGHSLGAACASIALSKNKDNSEIKHTGAFFGMPEVITNTKDGIKEIGTYVGAICQRLVKGDKKVSKFAQLGVETLVRSTSEFKDVLDKRAISINQDGDLITSSRRAKEIENEHLTYPTIDVVKDSNYFQLKHHSATDYALITKNMLDSLALRRYIKEIETNPKMANEVHEYYTGELGKLIEESSKKNILDRLHTLRTDITNVSSTKRKLN